MTTETTKTVEMTEEEAERVLRARYFTDCRDHATSIEDAISSKFKDDKPNADEDSVREAINEMIHEDVDGSQWIIYTWRNFEVLRWSDHHDAYVEEFGTDGVLKDGEVNWPALAYAAMHADVTDYVDADKLVEELCNGEEAPEVAE